MFVCLGYGWVGYFTFLFFLISLKLVCYAMNIVVNCSNINIITIYMT